MQDGVGDIMHTGHISDRLVTMTGIPKETTGGVNSKDIRAHASLFLLIAPILPTKKKQKVFNTAKTKNYVLSKLL
jgi:hypothetical protein